jgi:hypothetical protein
MASRRCKIGIAFGIVAGIFAGMYVLSRPNWRTLPDSELRANLHPALTKVDPPDPSARARWDRFRKVVNDLSIVPQPQPKNYRDVIARIVAGDPKLRELEGILAEGSLEGPEQQRAYQPPGGYEVADLARKYVAAAEIQIRARDYSRAARNCLLAIRISEEIGSIATDGHELTFQSRSYEDLYRVLLSSGLSLPERELGLIADAIPASTLEDRTLHSLLLKDIRRLVPALVDPIGWVQKENPSENPEQLLARFASGTFLGPETNAVLTYDALETVRNLNKVMIPSLENTKRSYVDQELSLLKYGVSLTSGYPVNAAAGKTGTAEWIAKMQYRWATARVRNALGNQFVAMLCQAIREMTDEVSFYRRTQRESIRTHLALRRYQLRHGRTAPNLDALVKDGLLPNLPMDLFNGSVLRYDPKRKLLWSVGENGKNDFGRTSAWGMRGEPDLAWKTP